MDLLLSKLAMKQQQEETKVKEEQFKNQDESTWGNQVESFTPVSYRSALIYYTHIR